MLSILNFPRTRQEGKLSISYIVDIKFSTYPVWKVDGKLGISYIVKIK